MVDRTDVFVIGGGPAGLAAAIAARRKGFSVTVADGSHPPIDKACGEGLMPDTLAALRELGVVFGPSEGQVVRGVRFLGRDGKVTATFPAGRGIGMRRPLLHGRLVERARSCGISLLWNTPIVGICNEGVKVREGVVPAKWIVGADGIGSRVRKWASLEVPARSDGRHAIRRHYRVSPWTEFMEIYWGDHAQAYVTPVAKDEVCVVLISRDRAMDFDSLVAGAPQLASRLAFATLVGSERGAITRTQKLHHVWRKQVALIGDASGSVDAITGQGLAVGFRQAVALANALETGDLSQYQAAHRRIVRGPVRMGYAMLLLDGRPSLRERTIRALALNPTVFSQLLAIHVGAKSLGHLAATAALLGWHFVAA